MLSYVLALVIGLGSFAFYMSAFFFPEVHRKSDFYLSGGGLFYALVLWVCAGRFTGWVLLSQIASVALLCWLGWQTLTLRRMLTSPEQQTPIPSQDKLPGVLQPVTNFLGNLLGKSKTAISTPQAKVGTSQETTAVEKEPVKEEVQQTTEVEIAEEEMVIESPFETLAGVEQEPEASTEEEGTVIDSPSKVVAEVEQEPEISTEEENTVVESPSKVVAEIEQEPEISTEEDTVIDSPSQVVAEVEQEPEISTEEENTVIESPSKVVAEVEQEPDVSTEEENTIIGSPSETLKEAPEPSNVTATSPEKTEINISSKKKQGFVQQVTGIFRKSKPVTPILVNQQKSRGKVNDAVESSMTPVVDDTETSEAVEPITTESSEAEISDTVETTNTELSATDPRQNKNKKKAN